jgi:C-terminal processing protease CtpA/Prc
MRVSLILIAGVLGVGLAMGAPGPRAPRPRTPEGAERTRSRHFAQQLLGIVDQIADQYVRPVSREALLSAALVGLYEAARIPVPRDLRPRIRRAFRWYERGLTSTAVPGQQAVVATPAGEETLEDLVREVREEVICAQTLQRAQPEEQQRVLVLACCKAMGRILDPYTTVITAAEQQRTFGLDPECYGVGLELNDVSGLAPPTVVAVQMGGPAQRAGLRPGDRITHLGGKPVRRAPPPGLLALRNQRISATVPPVIPAAGKKPAEPRAIRLTYRRTGSAERSVELWPERFRPETVLGVARRDDNTWNYFVDAKARIAHVRITALGRGTADELRGVLSELDERGKLGGLILDLRWCPGGYLNEAVDTADLFLGNGVIARLRSRGREEQVYRSTAANKPRAFPLVVLVNAETSGGAELITAALQDAGRAGVVGQRTLGKASVQTPLHLGVADVAMKLTSGTFRRPNGKNLHRFPESKPRDDWGVIPEEEGDCRVSADLGRRLCEWWLAQSLRPGGSCERLPLDDPSADPQRQIALALLRQRMAAKPAAPAKK